MPSIAKSGLVFAAAAVLAIPATAQKKNKEKVPEAAIQAKYVYVEAYDGPEWDPHVSAADRQAIADVERAVGSWGRYQLVAHRSEAEMVLQVRKGRTVEATAGGGISVDQVPSRIELPPTNRTETSTNARAGAETGPTDDLLFVYMVGADGQLNAMLWQRTQKDGLQAPDLKLFQKFKDDVNATVQTQAKKRAASGANPVDGNAPPAAPSAAPGAASNPPNPAPHPPGYR